MVAIKICGVRTTEAAAMCEDAGVNFVGLNFVPTSRRHVTLQRARHIRRVLGRTRGVGVFQNASLDELRRTVARVEVSWVQLHGMEPPELCARLREEGLTVIKALPVSGDIIARMAVYYGSADVLLLDSSVAGSGMLWSWETLAATPDWGAWRSNGDTPQLFVAGGVRPNTVAAAILTLAPDGIDVASGVESHGEIDSVKVRALCAAACTAVGTEHHTIRSVACGTTELR